MNYKTTTNYLEVNNLMQSLMSEVFDIAGKDQIVGIYLTGSLASGDFDPDKSDIDFIIVTKSDLPAEIVDQLRQMHQKIRTNGQPYSEKLDGDYIPQSAIRKYDPANSTYPHLGTDGHFAVEHHDSNEIIQWSVLRESGVVFYGPDPSELIDEISPDDVRKATAKFLHEWWEPKLSNHDLEDDEYQAYAILTMCRILYTLQFGKIASKPVAANWAKENYPQFAEAITAAQSWKKGDKMNFLLEGKNMIKFVMHF